MAWVIDPVTRKMWDPDRNLTLRYQRVRDTEAFAILEKDEPLIWFDGYISAGGPLSEEEQRQYPGLTQWLTWALTKDDGTGRFASKAARRPMIVEFFENFQGDGGVAGYEQGIPVFAKVNVLFDQPFVGD